MARSRSLPVRSKVKQADTWDLTPLFPDNDAWEKAFAELEKKIPQFESFRGTLGKSPESLRACLDFEMEFSKEAERLGSYAFLKSSEDVANTTYQAMIARYTHVATHAEEAASFIVPELHAIPEKKMERFLKSPVLAEYRIYLEKILRHRPHILSEKEERLLAMQGEIEGNVSRVFEQLNDADLEFGEITDEKGKKAALTQASFRSFLDSPDRAVRKQAFHQFYEQYEAHANTFSAALSGSVLQDIYHARVRNHPSALEASLFGDNVPKQVYESLIDAVHDNLDTVYHYLDVRRKALKLRDIRFYDTYVPIVEHKRTKTSFDKAVKTICEAFAPLGDEYCSVLHKGLQEERWVDRYENKGKRGGAFSAGGYTGPPYMLMNYRDDLIDSVFTLAHEAGHSMHTYYSAKVQPYQYYHYTIFVAEVASTFNEQLLNKYLLDQAKDQKTRAFLINKEIDEIRGTIIRQTMFAEFEKIIHEIVESGDALTLDVFRDEYHGLIERYFGPRFKIDDSLNLECLRIPHFYRAFYVYKYATGMAAAIALSQRVLGGGQAERDQYIQFLQSGSSKYPLDLLRDAGVDMEKPEPVATAMARMKELVAELEALV